MGKRKYRKDRFYLFKHLEFAINLNKVKRDESYVIPYYYAILPDKSKDKKLKLDIFHERGLTDLKELCYFVVRVPPEIYNELDLSLYRINNEEIKVTDESIFGNKLLKIPFPIFEIMLYDYRQNLDNRYNLYNDGRLSNILYYAKSYSSIEILDKKSKHIGYLIQFIEQKEEWNRGI